MTSRPTPAWHTTVRRDRAGQQAEIEVEVRSSARRRRSSTAFWSGDRIVVVLPGTLPAARQEEVVNGLVARVLARRPRAAASDQELEARAALLADRYVDGVLPDSIRWVTNQRLRWGSCSPLSRDIRLNHRLRAVPSWVLDAVIVHELAHLLEAGHGPRFKALVARYPRLAEADTYLAGFSAGINQADTDGGVAGQDGSDEGTCESVDGRLF